MRGLSCDPRNPSIGNDYSTPLQANAIERGIA